MGGSNPPAAPAKGSIQPTAKGGSMQSAPDGNGSFHRSGEGEGVSIRPLQPALKDLDEKIDRGDADLARRAVREIVGGPIFGAFRANPRGYLRVGVLEREVQVWAGYKTALVQLPERIMQKQEARSARLKGKTRGHPELTAEDYRRLPVLVEAPRAVFQPEPSPRRPTDAFDHRLCLWGVVDGRGYFAVVEHDPATEKVELISFFRREMSASQVEKMLNRVRRVFRKP